MLSFWFTIRQLRWNPARIAAVVLSLSIGMAICGAVFSLANSFLFAAVPGIVDFLHNLPTSKSSNGRARGRPG